MQNSIKQLPGYLPTLDGWRAVAIIAVIFHHDAVHAVGSFNTRWLYEYGSLGVDIFFAISGILICSRLLREEEANGFIHLREFYLRRCLRILPPALVYLFTIALLAKLSIISVSESDWWGAVLFCRNYPNLLGATNGLAGWYTSHFWSLSLEEQFYLLLPALLVFTPRKYRAWVLGSLALSVAAHRSLALSARPWQQIQFHAGARIDALFVPALFAVFASNARVRAWLERRLRYWPWMAVAAFLVVPFGKGQGWRETLLVWSLPCIVLGSVLNPGNPLGALLEWRPLRFIGRISYSLYLWQQLFFREHFAHDDHFMVWWQIWPLRLLLTCACALTSYLFLERPLSRKCGKWATRVKPAIQHITRALNPSTSLTDVRPGKSARLFPRRVATPE